MDNTLGKVKGKAGQDDKIIGHNIKKYRLLKNLTQEQLADQIGITFQQLQKYEKGTNRVTISRLADVSLALRVDLLSFFKGINFYFNRDSSFIMGLSEQDQSGYTTETGNDNKQKNADPFFDKKAIELVRYYAQINNEKARNQLIDLAKSLAEMSDQ